MEQWRTVPARPLIWDACVENLRAILPNGIDAYIVGGAVRDAYLHRPLHDIDIATPGDGRPLARLIADRLGGSYYPLDAERGVGRALVACDGAPLIVDVARFRGPDLIADLLARDFTVNAMAVRADGDLQEVIDPTGGLPDLQQKVLRQCRPDAIASDPVRALRGVRLSVGFQLRIERETRASLRAAAASLVSSSAERLRDELMQILGGSRPATALRVLDELGLLAPIVPEVNEMRGLAQSFPHQFDVLTHTLLTVANLASILKILEPNRTDEFASNIQAGAVAVALQPFLAELRAHVAQQWPGERPHTAVLMLAALLHDIGKPGTRSCDPGGAVHFYGHDTIGEQLARRRAEALRLSQAEVNRIAAIVRHHMRPHLLAAETATSARALYRFWRSAGAAGIDVILLAASDYLATYGHRLDTAAWIDYIGFLQRMLAYYFERMTSAAERPLLSGQQIIEHFGLTPGPRIGELLEDLLEAQAIGEISSRSEALEWVRRVLQDAP